MKNTTILWVTLIIIALAGAFFYFNSGSASKNGNATITNTEPQKITLSMKNSNYYPNTINVKEGRPVEITLDTSVKGCYRSFTIKDLSVRKYSASAEDKVTFTPTKKGTFTFACSMGMGFGKIVVE